MTVDLHQKDLAGALRAIGAEAKEAARALRDASVELKNKALHIAADNIRAQTEEILAVNATDVSRAQSDGLSDAMIDRITLTQQRLGDICAALREIAAQEDPLGRVLSSWERPNGLKIERVSVPIGVIAVIYESRPNVTIDAAAIALKAGNAVILRGGSDCLATSKALFACFSSAVKACGLSGGSAQIIPVADREAVGEILSGLGGAVDLVIPRGGKSLVARVQNEARVPVLSHLDGICHGFVHAAANVESAREIIFNAKMRRPGICGALETLLIDRAIFEEFWPALSAPLYEAGCEIRGDQNIIKIDPRAMLAREEDWTTEYLAPILSVAVVDGVNGALAHIAQYSSGHTETIITEDDDAAAHFLRSVDSAIVMHNASTQFADGGEFGLGAEIGIATGRLHARGPVGVNELTTYKNIVRGTGQARA